METFIATWRPRILNILRIVTAFLFMAHGTKKIFGFPAPQRSEFDWLSLTGAAGGGA